MRMIESFTRNRTTWEISTIYKNRTYLEERGQFQLNNIEPYTPSEMVYMVSYIVGLNGKNILKIFLLKIINLLGRFQSILLHTPTCIFSRKFIKIIKQNLCRFGNDFKS